MAQKNHASLMAGCNVVWTSPSDKPTGTMPIGNGDIGANVRVNPAGELVILISKTDAVSENGQLLKIGRLKLRFSEPLAMQEFRQELSLERGAIVISAKQGKTNIALEVRIDANNPLVVVEGESATPIDVEVVYDGWRRQPFTLEGDYRSAVYGIMKRKEPIITAPDVGETRKDEILWYHRNPSSIWRETLALQALSDYPGINSDPLLHNTFGALVSGDGFISSAPETLKTNKPVRRFNVNAVISSVPSATPEEWEKDIRAKKAVIDRQSAKQRKQLHEQYWKSRWDAHYIIVDAKGDDAEQVAGITSGYQLQRYVNLCAGRGALPIKFNGSIFTVDSTTAQHPFDPDYRNWGGCYWFQNTRLPYWTMQYSGDFDLTKSLYDMYMKAIPLSKFRVKKYYGHEGVQFPETMYFWGTYNNDNYGYDRSKLPDGLTENTYIRYYWSGVIELIAIMLEEYDFTRDEVLLKETLLPFASEVVMFYSRHYTQRTAEGKILFSPAQALETYQSCIQPMPEIAGLHFVLPRLLKLDGADEAFRQTCKELYDELPAMPTGEKNGKQSLVAGYELHWLRNIENAELYAIFPYRMFGLGKPDIELALNAFDERANRPAQGWQQNAIQAALLGLTDEAAAMVKSEFNTKHPDSRFPAFWGPNYDWVPDQDHGSVSMRALQNMLIQSDNDTITMFPAWPKEWNVKFKLHAPQNTVIEGELRDGTVVTLKVTPAERKDAVVMGTGY
jgi:hypothetical protein